MFSAVGRKGSTFKSDFQILSNFKKKSGEHIHREICKNAEAALVLPANSEDESSLEGFLPKSDFSKDDFRLPF